MIGSDKVGYWKGYAEEMNKYNIILERLSENTAKNLSKDNIKRLIDTDEKQ